MGDARNGTAGCLHHDIGLRFEQDVDLVRDETRVLDLCAPHGLGRRPAVSVRDGNDPDTRDPAQLGQRHPPEGAQPDDPHAQGPSVTVTCVQLSQRGVHDPAAIIRQPGPEASISLWYCRNLIGHFLG